MLSCCCSQSASALAICFPQKQYVTTFVRAAQRVMLGLNQLCSINFGLLKYSVFKRLASHNTRDCEMLLALSSVSGAVLQLHTSPEGNALFLHQDIREGRKQAGGVGGHLKLGTPLTIQMPGSDALTFEDLDDVIANFAEPYLENVRGLVSHGLQPCTQHHLLALAVPFKHYC